MRVNEFIEKYKRSNSTQTLSRIAEIKSYLPFYEKQELVNMVLRKCQVENYGYIQLDETKKYILFTIAVIEAYTNIEFDEDLKTAVSEYDALCEANLLNSIIETFEGEYKTTLNMMDMAQSYILQGNSINAQTAKFLSNLNDKLGSVLENLADSFMFGDLNITQEDIEKLSGFVKMLGE